MQSPPVPALCELEEKERKIHVQCMLLHNIKIFFLVPLLSVAFSAGDGKYASSSSPLGSKRYRDGDRKPAPSEPFSVQSPLHLTHTGPSHQSGSNDERERADRKEKKGVVDRRNGESLEDLEGSNLVRRGRKAA